MQRPHLAQDAALRRSADVFEHFAAALQRRGHHRRRTLRGGQLARGGRLEHGAHRAADEPLHRRLDRDERPRRALLRREGGEGALRDGAHFDVPRRRERDFPDARRRRLRAQNPDNYADARRGARPRDALPRHIFLRHDADDDIQLRQRRAARGRGHAPPALLSRGRRGHQRRA